MQPQPNFAHLKPIKGTRNLYTESRQNGILTVTTIFPRVMNVVERILIYSFFYKLRNKQLWYSWYSNICFGCIVESFFNVTILTRGQERELKERACKHVLESFFWKSVAFAYCCLVFDTLKQNNSSSAIFYLLIIIILILFKRIKTWGKCAILGFITQ